MFNSVVLTIHRSLSHDTFELILSFFFLVALPPTPPKKKDSVSTFTTAQIRLTTHSSHFTLKATHTYQGRLFTLLSQRAILSLNLAVDRK